MRRQAFGRTGLMLTPVMLGGHEYLPNGRSRGFNEDMRQAVTPGFIAEGYGGESRKRVLHAAYDLGVNVFDVTIDSEKEALGRNLREDPPPFEVHVQTRPEGMCYSYDRNNRKLLDRAGLRQEVLRCLRLLGRETLDLLNVGLLSWSFDNDPDYFDILGDNLASLKQEGLIRAAVADSFSGARLYHAMMACGAFDAVNLDLNPGDAAGLESVVPEARRQGLGVIAREAFLKGELFGIAAEAGLTDRAAVARAAMRWVAAARPDCLIIGVDNEAQLRADVLALDQPQPSDEDAELLDRLRRTPGLQAYQARKLAEFHETAP